MSASPLKGFTIIELIVSIAIFAAMTALVIAKYGTFNQSTLVTNVAYDMALSVRTAQTYGLSVKSSNSSLNSFDAAYGIHFDSTPANQNKFVFFADTDTPPNGLYDSQPDEAITTYSLNQNTKITSICLGSVYSSCNSNNIVTSLDVTFKRPNPDAIFCAKGNCQDQLNSQSIAFVTISSSDGSYKQVVYIRKNGEISVENN